MAVQINPVDLVNLLFSLVATLVASSVLFAVYYAKFKSKVDAVRDLVDVVDDDINAGKITDADFARIVRDIQVIVGTVTPAPPPAPPTPKK